MLCKDCSGPYAPTDNFCRRCGAALPVVALPALAADRALSLPWRPSKPTLVRGIAGLLLGAVAQLARREIRRRFFSPSVPTKAKQDASSSKKLPVKRGESQPSPLGDEQTGHIISETVVFWERQIRRR